MPTSPALYLHPCSGKFVSDSFHIFCRRRLSLAGVEDKNLQARQLAGGVCLPVLRIGLCVPSLHAATRGQASDWHRPYVLVQRYLRWRLGMEDEGQQQEKKRAERKRKAVKPAEAGTLRSGRRRASCHDSGGSTRRETRASAAAAKAAAKEGGEEAGAPAPKGRHTAKASRAGRRC